MALEDASGVATESQSSCLSVAEYQEVLRAIGADVDEIHQHIERLTELLKT